MRTMRHKNKMMETVEMTHLLTNAEYGVLSTVDAEGQPYGVPLNYVYEDGCIYFHCAQKGHKSENLEQNAKVSFTVVGATKVLPATFSTEFASVIAFGTASHVAKEDRHRVFRLLIEKFSPEFPEEGEAYIKKLDSVTALLQIEIAHMTGKHTYGKSASS